MSKRVLCAAHAVIVSGKIIRNETGAANNHRVDGKAVR
jgi:hypothetical protein